MKINHTNVLVWFLVNNEPQEKRVSLGERILSECSRCACCSLLNHFVQTCVGVVVAVLSKAEPFLQDQLVKFSPTEDWSSCLWNADIVHPHHRPPPSLLITHLLPFHCLIPSLSPSVCHTLSVHRPLALSSDAVSVFEVDEHLSQPIRDQRDEGEEDSDRWELKWNCKKTH